MINFKKTMWTGLLAIAALGFAACNNNANKETEQQDSTEATTASSTAEANDAQAAATAGISFKDEQGNTVELSSLAGKVVFINFWATWCPPCIHEMPSINDLRKSFKDNDQIVFLMVDVDGEIEQSSAFMKDNKYDLPVFIPNSNIPSDYLAGAIPTTVILDKKGQMADRMEGGRDYSTPEIKKGLQALIDQ